MALLTNSVDVAGMILVLKHSELEIKDKIAMVGEMAIVTEIKTKKIKFLKPLKILKKFQI